MSRLSAGLAKLVIPLPDLRSLAAVEARIIIAFRLGVISRKCNHDCLEELGNRLGGSRAAARLLILAESIAFIWPEHFQIGRPCHPHTKSDEVMLLNMMRHAVNGDRPAFDRLTNEMINPSGREKIYNDLTNFVAIYMDQIIN